MGQGTGRQRPPEATDDEIMMRRKNPAYVKKCGLWRARFQFPGHLHPRQCRDLVRKIIKESKGDQKLEKKYGLSTAIIWMVEADNREENVCAFYCGKKTEELKTDRGEDDHETEAGDIGDQGDATAPPTVKGAIRETEQSEESDSGVAAESPPPGAVSFNYADTRRPEITLLLGSQGIRLLVDTGACGSVLGSSTEIKWEKSGTIMIRNAGGGVECEPTTVPLIVRGPQIDKCVSRRLTDSCEYVYAESMLKQKGKKECCANVTDYVVHSPRGTRRRIKDYAGRKRRRECFVCGCKDHLARSCSQSTKWLEEESDTQVVELNYADHQRPEVTLLVEDMEVKFLVDTGVRESIIKADIANIKWKQEGSVFCRNAGGGASWEPVCRPLKVQDPGTKREVQCPFIISSASPINLCGGDLIGDLKMTLEPGPLRTVSEHALSDKGCLMFRGLMT